MLGGVSVLLVAAPGEAVIARVAVKTNEGRRFEFSNGVHADAAGRARIRMPHATGANGAVEAGQTWVRAGDRLAPVAVSEECVMLGLPVPVAISPGR